jgi:CDP-glycerol glycerophosphotransferase (TagB/SpsB family)
MVVEVVEEGETNPNVNYELQKSKSKSKAYRFQHRHHLSSDVSQQVDVALSPSDSNLLIVDYSAYMNYFICSERPITLYQHNGNK